MPIMFWPVPVIAIVFVLAGLAVMALVAVLSIRFSPCRGNAVAQGIAYETAKLVGGLVGLVLIFTLTQGMNYYREAEVAVSKEAGDFLQLDHSLAGISPAAGAPARLRLQDYLRSVIEQEWPAMRHFEDSQATDLLLEKLQAAVNTVFATDPSGATLLSVQRNLNDLEDDRTRRLGAADSSLPVPLWGTIGALFALLAASLFFLDPAGFPFRSFALYVACLTLVSALLFVVDGPYRGEFSVSPQLLVRSLNRMAAT